MATQPTYNFYFAPNQMPPMYMQTTAPPPPPQQLDTWAIVFIALSAFIALIVIIFLVVFIYNYCVYGTCCPPQYSPCCGCGPPPADDSPPAVCCGPMGWTCCYAPAAPYGPCCPWGPAPAAPVEKPIQVISAQPSIRSLRSPYVTEGTYIGRGTRLNRASYVIDSGAAQTIRTVPISSIGPSSRRNSLVLLPSDTIVSRRSVRPVVRPQIIVAEPSVDPGLTIRRRGSVAGSNLLAIPPASHSSVRCYAINEPIRVASTAVDSGVLYNSSSSNFNGGGDDGDIRVIVRNQPYQRATILDDGGDFRSAISPPPAFESLTIRKAGAPMDGVFGGYMGQHSAAADVTLDIQGADFASDDGLQYGQQTMYPTLSQPSFY